MHPFHPKDFVQTLVNQFHGAEGGVDNLLETEKASQYLTQEFNEFVNEKKFLVVLNDLSTIEEWDWFKKCFQNNMKGSRIVVSTSQIEVASLCAGKESQASELKQLSADQTLYAFYDNKGFQNGKGLVKPVSSPDVATSTNDHSVAAASEIIEDQPKGVDENKVVKKNLSRTRTSAGASEESQLIGRDKEISKIIELISNRNSQQGLVISVWGMGGLGKTTLVHDIYHSPKLSDMFDKRSFITIMRPFNPADLLNSVIVGLREEYSKKDQLFNDRTRKNESFATPSVKDSTEELKRLLDTNRCLIVLDDLSSIEEWNQIKQGFCWKGKATIIVTTREENIAKLCSRKEENIHNLEVLNEEDATNLFCEKVFGKDTEFVNKNPELVEEVNQTLKKDGKRPVEKATDLVEKNPEVLEEANKILKKCDGLPLAIVTIGGYLASRPKTRDEWRKLNENISSELEMNPELGTIRTVLEKSYDGLSYHLKSCFIYLSIFPEDQIISRRRLVRRWAAEGYSSEQCGRSGNEAAENYFNELKNRSMILPCQQSAHSRKSIDSCKVHDLIRDIAISKSMEENLVFILKEGCGSSTHGTFRHLAISSNWKGDQSEFEYSGSVTITFINCVWALQAILHF